MEGELNFRNPKVIKAKNIIIEKYRNDREHVGYFIVFI